ncbi:MAG: efflux RND transporter periplasmic adaptor subunit [candidate division NC10 bacterium]|nr:efflux RND transporter periplasmic adaptor subunit [candidate division NC10 bacterium]
MKKATHALLLCLVMAGVFLAGGWYYQQGANKAEPGGVRKILSYVDPMHPAYPSDRPGIAPDCGMELVPVYEDGSTSAAGSSAQGSPRTVPLSLEKQRLLGVRVVSVERAAGTQTLRLLGRVAPDETRLYRLNAAVDGWVREVAPVTTGSRVEKGQWLATFAASDLFVSAQALVFALTAVERLARSGQESPAVTNPTTSNFQQRIEKLQSLGMSASQIEEIRHTREIPQGIKVFAPAAGFVLARNLSDGQKFEKGAEWFRLADLGRVWIVADVFKSEAKHLRPGTLARVALPDDPEVIFQARVSDILHPFDVGTQTLKVRLETENPQHLLRPDMFVDVELPVTRPPALSVPVDAVVDSGVQKTVYVVKEEGRFEPRRVVTGWRHGDRVEIVQGLTVGDRVVLSSAFLLDSESRVKAAATGLSGESPARFARQAAPPAPAVGKRPREVGWQVPGPAASAHAGHGHETLPVTAGGHRHP